MTQSAVTAEADLGAPRNRRTAGRTGVGLALAVAGVAAGATSAHGAEVVVQPGDTVSHIALRSGSSVSAIVRANGLDRRATIRVGQRLVVPAPGDTATPAKASTPAKAATTAAVTHTVVRGDTVSALARRHGTTVGAIVKANGLDSRAFIRIGQTLTIPGSSGDGTAATSTKSTKGSTTGASATPSSVRHTVRSGDTVSALAARHGTTVAAIVKANGLDGRAFIRVGQTLTIPSTSGSAAVSDTPEVQLVGNTFAGRTYPEATVASANENKATLLALGAPSKAEMRTLVRDTARAMGVDPALALAIAHQESGFDQTAVSPANAIGTMQVIPSSGRWASELVGRELNLLDPRDNVTAGVAILRRLVATSPDLPTAIAGYYQGQAGVRKYGMFPDTRRYVANVQTLMSRFA